MCSVLSSLKMAARISNEPHINKWTQANGNTHELGLVHAYILVCVRLPIHVCACLQFVGA